jgi:hypothetical protein
VVLVRERAGQENNSVHWLWNPLADLKDCEREVRRTWKDESDPDAAISEDWGVQAPEGKDRPPSSYRIRVTLSDELLGGLDSEMNAIVARLA